MSSSQDFSIGRSISLTKSSSVRALLLSTVWARELKADSTAETVDCARIGCWGGSGGASKFGHQFKTAAELAKASAESFAEARTVLQGTTDEHLMKNWQLKVKGQVVAEGPRHVMMRDVLMHLSHHRGQMTVYLRLCGAKVPSIYGPSADDQRF